MKVGELMTNIIKMLEEDRININDEVQVEVDMAELDITNIVESITTKVTENYDKFVFETIRPYCEEVTQQVIDKKTLSQALIKHCGQNVRQIGKCPNCNRYWHLHPQYVEGLSEIYCYRCGMKIILRRRNDS